MGNAVLPNANVNQRFSFTNASPTARPGPAAVSRIAGNQAAIGAVGSVNGRAIQQRLTTAPLGKPVQGAGVSAPMATSRLISGAGTQGSQAAGTGPRALKQNVRAVQPGVHQVTTGSVSGGKGPGVGAVQSGKSVGRTGAVGVSKVGRGQTGVGSAKGANIGRSGRVTSHGSSKVRTMQGAPGSTRSTPRIGTSGKSQFRGTPKGERRGGTGSLQGVHRAPQSGMRAPAGGHGSPSIQRAPKGNPGGGHFAPKGGQGPGAGRGGNRSKS